MTICMSRVEKGISGIMEELMHLRPAFDLTCYQEPCLRPLQYDGAFRSLGRRPSGVEAPAK